MQHLFHFRRCLIHLLFFVFSFLFLLPGLLAQCPITVSAGEDKYLCAPPTPVQLNGEITGQYLSFQWSPTTGLSSSNTLTPFASVGTTTTYILRAKSALTNNNLVVNGDFESGNTSFSTDYTYNPGFTLPNPYGTYEIAPVPSTGIFLPCSDHTGGGNYMIIDGADQPNKLLWCQTVSVAPNTEYLLSTWVLSVGGGPPFALLKFTINGTQVGGLFSAPPQGCNWVQFTGIWNSGANTTANICIEDLTVGGAYNDFAIDDIALYPVCTVTDTVKVHILPVQAVAAPAISTIPCSGATVTLNGTGSSTGPNITYQWTTPNGNIVSGDNTLMPLVDAAGAYTLIVSNNYPGGACTKSMTVNVIEPANQLMAWIISPPPLGCGTSLVALNGNASQAAVTYSWTTSDGRIVTGANGKVATVDKPGTYLLTVQNSVNGCTATASVTVTAVNNTPVANATVAGPITCLKPQMPLSGAGSSTGPGITYLWTTTNGTLIGKKDSIHALAGTAGTYVLLVSVSTCIKTDTVVVTANTTRPTITLARRDTLDCAQDTLTLLPTFTPHDSLLTFAWVATNGGNIASGANTSKPKITAAGIYTLTATHKINGCTAVAADTVAANFTPPLAVIQPPPTLSCQISQVTLSSMGSTGPNFTYIWTGPGIVGSDSTITITANSVGTYHLLVFNEINSCTATTSVQVASDQSALTAAANAPGPLTCAVTAVVLNANGSTTGPGITYTWTTTNGTLSANPNTPNPTVSAPGLYQLLITDPANGCSGTATVTVLRDAIAPSISILPVATLTCIDTIAVLLGQNVASGNFIYNWTTTGGGSIFSGNGTLTPIINTTGAYTLMATNSVNGCTSTATVQLQFDTIKPIVFIAPADSLTCKDLTVMLTASGSPLGTPFDFQWAASNGGNVFSDQNTATPVVNAPGTYVVTVKNTLTGCTTTATAQVVTDLQAAPVNILPAPVLNCLHPNDTLLLVNTDPAFTYDWLTANGQFVSGQNTASPIVNKAGTYVVTVTNPANGCTATAPISLQEDFAPPAAAAGPDLTLTCTVQQVALQGSGAAGYTAQWTTLGGNFIGSPQGYGPSANAPGTYTITVTNPANGCTATDVMTILRDILPPVLDAGPGSILNCAVTSLVLQSTANGTLTYAWTGPSGFSSSTLQPTVSTPGAYILTGTSTQNGCSSSDTTSVGQDIDLPSVEAGVNDTISCFANALILKGSASGGTNLTYTWTASNGGNIVMGGNTPSPTVNTAGIYFLEVKNTANQCRAVDSVFVFNDKNAPVASIATPATLTCLLQQTTLNAANNIGINVTYTWNGPNGFNTNGQQAAVNTPDVYTLTVTDNTNGCKTTATATVLQNITPPPVQIAAPGLLTCQDTVLTLAGSPSSGNYTWNWVCAGGGKIVSGGAAATPKIDAPGTYTLTMQDVDNGCSATASVSVVENITPPTTGIASPQTLTCNLQTVVLQGNAQGQPGGFSISWTTSNGHFVSAQNTLQPTVDKPGVYVLTIQNTLNGCVATASATVTQSVSLPTANGGPPKTITCAEPGTTLDGSASSAGMDYAWTGPNGFSSISLLPIVTIPGTYILTVTNTANNCSATASVQVTADTVRPKIVIAPPLLLTCIRTAITLDASASETGLTIGWTTGGGIFTGGQTTLQPQVSKAGTYIITLTNPQNGCSSTQQTVVSQDIVLPDVKAGPDGVLHCNQLTVNLQGSSATAGSMQFTWFTSNGNIAGGNTTLTPVADAPGTYRLAVTNPQNGCTASDEAVVTEVGLPTFELKTEQPHCKLPTGTITVQNVAGGLQPYRYSDDGGNTYTSLSKFSTLKPGVYAISVKDAYGCSTEQTVEINPPALPSIQLPPFITVALGDSVQLRAVTVPDSSSVASWKWSPVEGLSCTDCPAPFASVLGTTAYRLVISDAGGCTAQAMISVRVLKRLNIYAPNIISPDGNGLNDFFTLFGNGATEIQMMQIFDRWGELLWEGAHLSLDDEAAGWDGVFRGSAAPTGVYVWKAVVLLADGTREVLRGDVTVVR